MKARRIARHPVMTAKDRRFEKLLRRAAKLSNRSNGDLGPRPDARKHNAAAYISPMRRHTFPKDGEAVSPTLKSPSCDD